MESGVRSVGFRGDFTNDTAVEFMTIAKSIKCQNSTKHIVYAK